MIESSPDEENECQATTSTDDVVVRLNKRAHRTVNKEFTKTRRTISIVTAVCVLLIVLVTIITLAVTRSSRNDDPPPAATKFPCIIAGSSPTKKSCERIGCMFNPDSTDKSNPTCFYPHTNFGYQVNSIGEDGTVYLKWKGEYQLHATQINEVSVKVTEYSNKMLRLVIKDPGSRRYEVPIDITPTGTYDLSNRLYEVHMPQTKYEPFWIYIKRVSTGEVLFDTRNTTLVFLDQLLEITSFLPSKRFYGMAERGAPFVRSVDYVTMPLFAHDNYPSPIGQDINLYSSQPFYMLVEDNGDAHGVMVYNSNAMEVYLTPAPSVTLRALGGILDLYFFLGPSPLEVTEQLTDLIGKPFLPPYWSLGFHLCRYGYKDLKETKDTFTRNFDGGLTMDVQWQDIDYMNEWLIFTIDETNYSGLMDFVKKIQTDKKVKYVIIVDPAVGHRKGFSVYERGLLHDAYIKNSTGQNIIGKVWPGETVFPDFTSDQAAEWWKTEMVNFHKELPYNGIWLDMNEPANFDAAGTHGSIYGCSNNSINYPPYKPNTSGNVMFYKTLCLDAKQAWGIQRDLHNLYGITETKATYAALKELLPNDRPFIISRSTFLGSGKAAGHWLGDNESSWKHLRQSIIGILDFNLIGIPMTGADIGGFAGDVTEELLIRWHQLGAWYPFSRNHNSKDSTNQDPASFPGAFPRIKTAIEVRYQLLSYWYTQFVLAHRTGKPVFRATFQNFPQDEMLFDKDFDEKFTQFMVGEKILVAPVVTQGATKTTVYLPVSSGWYLYSNGEYNRQENGIVEVAVSLDELPYFVKEGTVLFKQLEGQTSTDRLEAPFHIEILLDEGQQATGFVLLETDTTESTGQAKLEIRFNKNEIDLSFYGSADSQSKLTNKVKYENILVKGLENKVASIQLGDQTLSNECFTYDETKMELIINDSQTILSNMDAFISFKISIEYEI